jgi:hypothetical protein
MHDIVLFIVIHTSLKGYNSILFHTSMVIAYFVGYYIFLVSKRSVLSVWIYMVMDCLRPVLLLYVSVKSLMLEPQSVLLSIRVICLAIFSHKLLIT